MLKVILTGSIKDINELREKYMNNLPCAQEFYLEDMVVSKKHRNKGVGTYIISKLKEHCIGNDLVPICGCLYYNYASNKTLEKAGFITNHRIVKF